MSSDSSDSDDSSSSSSSSDDDDVVVTPQHELDDAILNGIVNHLNGVNRFGWKKDVLYGFDIDKLTIICRRDSGSNLLRLMYGTCGQSFNVLHNQFLSL